MAQSSTPQSPKETPPPTVQTGANVRLSFGRSRIPLFAGIVIAILGLLFGSLATASAHTGSGHGSDPKADPSFTPRSDSQISNVTILEDQIKSYYGDTVVGTEHLPSPTGNYAKQMAQIEAGAKAYLAAAIKHDDHGKQDSHSKAKPALVFDVDDTTLNTYNYEIFSNFAYNPTTNADYVNNAKFPSVFGMPALVNWAASKGYTVFFLTGRPETQRDGTVTNLSKVGYTAPADPSHLYLKFASGTTPPSYLHCAAVTTCTTIEYKSGTRQHIESLGYNIVGNFGDQYSDLSGGSADHGFKLPNPMYYLP